VLLSDGENTEAPDPLEVAETAIDYGIRVYTVGMGSAEGTTLNIDGFTVFTRLDEATLQQIAEITNGAYYNAQSEEELLSIYAALDEQLVVRAEETEVTALFAGISTFILLIGGILSLLLFGRLP
jgi:Ca-activated chloride channel family protein